MPAGVPNVFFENINFTVGMNDLVVGEVRLTFDDEIDGEVVTHHVTTKVRIKVPVAATIEELHSSLLAATEAQLHRALQGIEGKSARDVVSGAEAKLEADEIDALRSMKVTFPT